MTGCLDFNIGLAYFVIFVDRTTNSTCFASAGIQDRCLKGGAPLFNIRCNNLHVWHTSYSRKNAKESAIDSTLLRRLLQIKTTDAIVQNRSVVQSQPISHTFSLRNRRSDGWHERRKQGTRFRESPKGWQEPRNC